MMRFSLANYFLNISYNKFKQIIEATLSALPSNPDIVIERYSGLIRTTSFLDDFLQSSCDDYNKTLKMPQLKFSDINKDDYDDTFYFNINFRNAPHGSSAFDSPEYYWVNLQFKGGNKKQATFYAQCGKRFSLDNLKKDITKLFPRMLVGDGFFGGHTNLNSGNTLGYMKSKLGF